MCEIAIVNPDSIDPETTSQLAAELYSENPDGLGFVAVYRRNGFEYDTLKAETPDSERFERFLWESADAWRLIIHARLATAGGTGIAETHPIRVNCDKCDSKLVIHNGWVHSHRSHMRDLGTNGHSFTTTVDSEVLPHKWGQLPTHVDDISDGHSGVNGSLNYILCGDSSILIHNTGKYHLTDDMRMSCRNRSLDHSGDSQWLVATPDEITTKTDRRQRGHTGFSFGGYGTCATDGCKVLTGGEYCNKCERSAESDECYRCGNAGTGLFCKEHADSSDECALCKVVDASDRRDKTKCSEHRHTDDSRMQKYTKYLKGGWR